MPEVSIIISAYNAVGTVKDTIDSAIGQNYPADKFNVLVLDDGSTDGTWNVMTSYVGITPIFQRIHRGLQETVNWAVTQTNCDKLVMLGADDTLHPNFLLKTVPVFAANSRVGVVSPDMQYFGREHGICRTGICTPFANRIPATSLIRRAAWDEVGGYSVDMGYEDWDLWLKIQKAGWLFAKVPEPLVNYRLGINARSKLQDEVKAELEAQIKERHL